jgi:hypothetical protein
MFENLKNEVNNKTYHIVEFFQLRSIRLPEEFENEIE